MANRAYYRFGCEIVTPEKCLDFVHLDGFPFCTLRIPSENPSEDEA